MSNIMSTSSPPLSLVGEKYGPVRQVLISPSAHRVKAKIYHRFQRTRRRRRRSEGSLWYSIMHRTHSLLPRCSGSAIEEAIPFRNGGLVKHVLCSKFRLSRLSFRGFLPRELTSSMHFWKCIQPSQTAFIFSAPFKGWIFGLYSMVFLWIIFSSCITCDDSFQHCISWLMMLCRKWTFPKEVHHWKYREGKRFWAEVRM